MEYTEYERLVRRWVAVATVREYGRVQESGREYPLYCLETQGAARLVVTAGFHGEEPAGPLTLAHHFGEVAAYASARGVGLRVYPCINPSGFERGTRYNTSGEHPNNDFLRYRLGDGSLREEVGLGEGFAGWEFPESGPKETLALRRDLSQAPAPHAALDLHQDAWVKRPCFYAYHFGERRPFQEVVRRCLRWGKVGVNVAVHDHSHTDAHGLIVHHDGSISDWLHRRAVPWVAVLETSTRLSRQVCDALNLEWIRAFVDFAAQAHRSPR